MVFNFSHASLIDENTGRSSSYFESLSLNNIRLWTEVDDYKFPMVLTAVRSNYTAIVSGGQVYAVATTELIDQGYSVPVLA